MRQVQKFSARHATRKKKFQKSCSKPTQVFARRTKTVPWWFRQIFWKKNFFSSLDQFFGAVSFDPSLSLAWKISVRILIGTQDSVVQDSSTIRIVPSARGYSSETNLGCCVLNPQIMLRPGVVEAALREMAKTINNKNYKTKWIKIKKKFLLLLFRQWPPSTARIHTVTWKGYPHRVTLLHMRGLWGPIVHPLTARPFTQIMYRQRLSSASCSFAT